ncbi:hypothetical protein SUGI_1113770 [Cryptomeria japonica]|nr:hypothetical protein SUGI_1113770 [Cryptomeria japonica]
MASFFKHMTIPEIGLCLNLYLRPRIHESRHIHRSYRRFSSPSAKTFLPLSKAQAGLTLGWNQEKSIKLQVPLFERKPIFSTNLHDLIEWRKWAQELANSVGSRFLETDGGPESKDLLREIEWLLEDTVDGYSTHSAMHELPADLALRTSIEDLYVLWRERVEKRRPFQYIVGCAHWRDLVLAVQEGVLIPRPETEQLIDIAQNVMLRDGTLAKGVWADLGTGSGALAIGLSLLLEAQGRVVAVDLSHVAVSVARYNVERYGLQALVDVRQGSWFSPIQDVNGQLAGLLSNPPYIPSDQISGLQSEVGKHEPRLALDGGIEGFSDLVLLCKGAISALRPGGFVGFETNGGRQAEVIADNLCSTSENSFRDVQIIADYAGIPRFVTALRC